MNIGNPVRVFWCEPDGRTQRYFRCYQSNDGSQRGVGERADDPTLKERSVCDGPYGYCNAMRVLDVIETEWTDREDGGKWRKGYSAKDWPFDAFPTVCERCGREMDKPERQVFTDEFYVVKTGERDDEFGLNVRVGGEPLD